ncbi:MAG: hypothetical protein A2W91_07925 [Bacteroidetes bacterium GWF2_38_335]|nr:MAG: hypothetical protein A2W91_07925 [Bacteroidetes bacterium GWF2_38_335]OFY79021.1 MAG: hypothetical protein A2281_02795 [Bacteroidetes bacterium RIFOXYA12_FULL_38_20]HBS86100.1 hypothetical protein [Bacteroidales bacterium]
MKNRPENKIDELFSEAFKGYSPAPPGAVWDRIKSTVADDSKNKPKSFWIKYRMFFTIAACLIIVSGVSSAYLLSGGSDLSSGKSISLNTTEKSQSDRTVDNTNEISGTTNNSMTNEIADETNYTQKTTNQNNNSIINKTAGTVKTGNNASENSASEKSQALSNAEKTTVKNPDLSSKNDVAEKSDKLSSESKSANKDLIYNNSSEKSVKTDLQNAEAKLTNPNEKLTTPVDNKTTHTATADSNTEKSVNTETAVNNNEQVLVAANGVESKVTSNNDDAKLNDHSNDDVSHNYNDYAKNYETDNKPVILKAETMKDSITGPSIDLPVPTKASYTPSKFAIGVHYTAENLFHLTDAKYLPDQTYNMTGNSYEVSLNFRITPKLTLSTGIGYTEYRENVYYEVVHDKQVIVDSVYTGSEWAYVYETQTMTYEEQLKNSYSYVRMPLSIRYKLLEAERFSLHASIGGIFSQIMNKMEREPVIPDGINLVSVTRKTPEQNTYTIMFATGLSAHYKLSDFLTLAGDVLYKTNMSTYYKDNGTEMKVPYSIGFRVGLYANF